MYNEVIKLISESKSTDAYGDTVIQETERTVFCKVASIGQKEFYQSQAVGLKPEIKFVLSDYFEYQNELVCEYNGERYKILRTYRNGLTLELTCYREVNKGERS